jgi:hypothetical protein
MHKKIKVALSVTTFLLSFGLFQAAHATLISTYYGDDDGFGIGAFSGTLNPDISHQDAGEAAFTDMRLIADGFYVAPAFTPEGGFDPFSLDGAITSITLTMRMGAFDSSPALDAPNRIYLDGMLVDSSFIDGYSTANSQVIETMSITLDSSFFSLFTDGVVSLAGTHISEASGSGSFQIDFLRLDIITDTASVPEPASIALLGLGLAGLSFSRKKQNS